MKKVLLIGHPLGHSASKIFQNAGFQALGIDVVYENCDVESKEFEPKISEIKSLDDCLGFNVTIPYKTGIVDLLDNITSDSYADIMGAVNTVVRKQNGELWGYNTDVIGFREAVNKKLDFNFSGRNILVVGAGGVGRAVVAAVELGSEIERVSSIVIADIDLPKAEQIVSETKAGRPGSKLTAKDADNIDEEVEKADLIVNATPLGMGEDKRVPINTDLLHEGQYLFDVVYNPVETALLQKAKEKGLSCSNGLSMLFYQGWAAFKLWVKEYNSRFSKNIIADNKIQSFMKDALKNHFGVIEL